MAPAGIQRRKVELLLEEVDHLPTLPGVSLHVLPLAMADTPPCRDIQLAIETDPTLAARTLKLAIDLGTPADALMSIDAALKAVPPDALTASLLSIDTVDQDVARDVELPRLWRHALATALASQVIAMRIGTVAPETALLAGLLHDIGQVALRVLMPRAYGQVLERLRAGGTDLLEAERDVFGLDHAVLGRQLAQRWGFAEPIQGVIWLHHQAQIPNANRDASGGLTELVRLADLLARQHGFSYHAAEQISENTAEVAERLGLSGIQAEQIGHQISSAIEFNAEPLGLRDEPSPKDLGRVFLGANLRLGQLYRNGYNLCHTAEVKSRQSSLLLDLNARLATCHDTRDVLETLASAACSTLGVQVAVPYVVSTDGTYVEGVRCTRGGGAEEHFLYDITADPSLEPPPARPNTLLPASSAPVRAERVEGWLFERQGAHLGSGPFYMAAISVEDAKLGALVFSMGNPPRELTPEEAHQVAAVTSIAGTALKRAQAEADLVALSEELAHVNRRLEAAHHKSLRQQNVASLSEMALGAAHEINNPLAIISGRAQQLAAREDDPSTRGILQTIIEQADRISEVISELRAFAKPPAPRPASVDPAALAHRVLDALEEQRASAAVPVELDVEEAVPLIDADPDQVAAALGEIVMNAVEACSRADGGSVRLRVQSLTAEESVRFEVTDNGPGMDPQVRARAFDPFYSGYEAGRRRGLGLPKAYRAVQANGGDITLESTPGKGTTVRVTFPAAEPAPLEPANGTARAGGVSRT
ncbi:MAG TPA: HDOD domain-containing protein [Phycisphaerae bacterium]|nr:HDOD domain-containing protein [Phycisphaerae bacterium]